MIHRSLSTRWCGFLRDRFNQQHTFTTNHQTMSPEESAPNINDQDTSKVPMVLISLAQRNSLIEYLAQQPYQDVANGIEFLKNAPVVNVNLTDDGSADPATADGA